MDQIITSSGTSKQRVAGFRRRRTGPQAIPVSRSGYDLACQATISPLVSRRLRGSSCLAQLSDRAIQRYVSESICYEAESACSRFLCHASLDSSRMGGSRSAAYPDSGATPATSELHGRSLKTNVAHQMEDLKCTRSSQRCCGATPGVLGTSAHRGRTRDLP